MTPAGTALIVGFLVILAVCIWIDKNSNKKFAKRIDEEYPQLEILGAAWVTEKGELLFACGSGTLLGYKKWNLKDVAYIGTNSAGRMKGQFSFYDKNGEVMRGEYLTPSRKPLKEKLYCSFYIGVGHIDEFVAFVKKYGPHIEHMVNGKVVPY